MADLRSKPPRDTPKSAGDWFGFRRIPDWTKSRRLGGLLGVVLILLSVVLVLLALIATFRILWPASDAPETSLGFGALVVTILGAPLVIWRTLVAQQTVNLQKEGLMTDRISKAVEQLGAEKTVKRQRRNQTDRPLYEDGADGKVDYKKPIHEEVTRPNIEVRIGGIYALERIAQDSITSDGGRDHVRVMEILCAYVRENAPLSNARQSPHEVFEDLTTNTDRVAGLSAEDAYQHDRYKEADTHGWDPTELSHENLQVWSRSLGPPRTDIQAALTVIGRRRVEGLVFEQQSHFHIDLTRTGLQKTILKGTFSEADFTGSALDGAELTGFFNGAHFQQASLQSARGWRCEFDQSDFRFANLNGAYFGDSRLDGAQFWYSSMDHTNFNGASAKESDWFGAKPRNVYFYFGADLSGSRLQGFDLAEIKGIEEGPTGNLWIDITIENSGVLADDRYAKRSPLHEPELDFRRDWVASKNSNTPHGGAATDLTRPSG